MSKIFSGSRVRTAIALLLAGLAGVVYVPRLISVDTTEAVLNGRAIVVRAPIDGRVTWSTAQIGDPVADGDVIGHVSPLRDIGSEHEATQLKAEILSSRQRLAAVAAEQGELDRLESELLGQSSTWQAGAITRAHQKLVAAEAAMIAAKRTAATAKKEATTTAQMAKNGVVGALEADRTAARAAEAASALAAAKAEVEKAKVEAKTAESGLNLTDGQNDVPYSRQRLNEITMKRTELVARAADINAVIGSLEMRLSEISRSQAAAWNLESSTDAVLFRRLSASGSDVLKGQELAVLVDCNDLFVEARMSMDEAANLAIGDNARIEIAGRPGALHGSVRVARGWAPGEATDANASTLQPPAEERWALVEIAIDTKELRIGDDSHCRIGSGARVQFERDLLGDYLD